MKNKLSIGIITFIVGVIFSLTFFNLFDSNDKKDYYFDREYNPNNLLSFEKNSSKMNSDEYIRYIHSNDYIVEYEIKSSDKNHNEYKFYFTDYNFIKVDTSLISLPKLSNILLFNMDYLLYTDKFKLYRYNFKSKIHTELNFKGLKVFSVFETDSKYICFGENYNKGIYTTGFFIIDLKNLEIIPSKVLMEESSSITPKNALMYSGSFKKSFDNKYICYNCDKFSEIYVFKNNGTLIKTIITKDETPLSKILSNDNGATFYARGTAWNTNMGVFIKNNYIYVFSDRSDERHNIILDQYSLESTKYVQSYKINYDGVSDSGIRNVYENDGKIIINFETEYASFIISRNNI